MVKIPIRSDLHDPPGMKPLDVQHFLVLIQMFSFRHFFGDLFGTLAILKCTPLITLRFSAFCKQNKVIYFFLKIRREIGNLFCREKLSSRVKEFHIRIHFKVSKIPTDMFEMSKSRIFSFVQKIFQI